MTKNLLIGIIEKLHLFNLFMVEKVAVGSSRAHISASQWKRLLKHLKWSYKQVKRIQEKSDESHSMEMQEAENYLDTSLSS